MIQRKKSMRQAYADKMRQKPPQEWPGRKSAVLSRKGAQDGAQATRKPRDGLKRQSAKAKALVTPRKKCIAAVRLRSGGRCEVRIQAICTGWHDHTHEIKARSAGGSITDPANCLAVCFVCHRWLDEHANMARELGFIAPRGV